MNSLQSAKANLKAAITYLDIALESKHDLATLRPDVLELAYELIYLIDLLDTDNNDEIVKIEGYSWLLICNLKDKLSKAIKDDVDWSLATKIDDKYKELLTDEEDYMILEAEIDAEEEYI